MQVTRLSVLMALEMVALLACGGSGASDLGPATDVDARESIAPPADVPADSGDEDAGPVEVADGEDAPAGVDAQEAAGDLPLPPDAAEADEADTAWPATDDDLVAIPAGSFEMGDHSGLGGQDPAHPSDEVPLHTLQISAFHLGRTEVTCARYVAFLDAAYAAGELEVSDGVVRGQGAPAIWFQTRAADPTSPVTFEGGTFAVADGRDQHPITHVRWEGAAAYANWRSRQEGLAPCIDLASGTLDYAVPCYRLPTEAEWEYAALGGRTDPYPVYPWGDDLDPLKANWPSSADPWEPGPEPKTTPVGFFDGSLRHKADFGWPAPLETFQTHDGTNGYGLVDMAGNAWEWVADWYGRDYYAKSPAANPPGPTEAEASPMPDGKKYRGMRGGNWYNGTTPERPDGHSRVSNRDPSYFRGPGDPNGPWFHVGFRLVLAHAEGDTP